MRVCVINGPNLNMLGRRQPEIYGSETLPDIEAGLVSWGQRHGLEISTFQSNHEGELIDRIQACHGGMDGIVINPGAYGHTSYAIHDALLFSEVPTVEVHMSNVHARDPFRAISVLAPVVLRKIFGRGATGYRDALRLLLNQAAAAPQTVPYGNHPEQLMDLRPARGKVAVLIHGGFWRHEWGRDTIDSLAVDLTQRGWTTANVEYRRLGCDGGWPTTADDVATAIDRVAVDTGAAGVTLVGHSAGGQLALVAARSPHVEAVIALAPIADLVRALELGTGAPSLEQFLGGADPAGPASPLSDPPSATQVVVHGTADSQVALELSERYVAAATARGIAVTTRYPDVGHFELLDPASAAWGEAIAAL